MKTIVVYKSKTGFTERYARWIAEAGTQQAIQSSYDVSSKAYVEPLVEFVRSPGNHYRPMAEY